MAPVYRFIEYHRVFWFGEGAGNLEEAVRDAYAVLPNSRDRVVERADGASDMGAMFALYEGEGVAIHCTRYVEGQPAGVVSMIAQNQTPVAERAPGNQENFLHRDFIAFIRGDHVVTMNAAQGGASVRAFLHGLFRLAELEEHRSQFGLMKRPALDQIARIEAGGGVESIQLDLSIDEATALAVEDANPAHPGWNARRILSPLKEMMSDLFMADIPASDVGQSEKGRLRLSISVPQGDLVAAKDGLDGLGELLVEDEDARDYMIRLRNGDQIRPNEMAVKKRVRIERLANTVSTGQVIEEMRTFMQELNASGQLG
ncbi:conserved hypothetical protein [Citreicella sp. SE45]|nr:conserved hypothetical protein [Citreicella sp. SE45]